MSELAGHRTHTELVAEVERLRERVANYERYVEREIEPKLLAEVERLRKIEEAARLIQAYEQAGGNDWWEAHAKLYLALAGEENP
jgi:hypothetical protein